MASVADAVRRFGPAYRVRYRDGLLPSHRRVLRDLAACRTPALGGHVTQCDHCGAEHVVYHSCRNRSCPTCHGAATAAWLAAREAELLPVPYFHVVFTLPSALRAIVRTHQRALLAALMTTAAESLQALAADPRYVGGTLGILAVLHTWTRALIYHPHVHCLVPGGALAPDGQTWRPARRTFLVPVRALSVGFRARFLAQVKARCPDVVVPAAVWRQPWVVYCKPTVQGSAPVLRYLARYVHRVAITDARVRAVTAETVRFDYKDRRAAAGACWRTMTVSGDEFLRRFLQHVLPRGFHKVRYYGLARAGAATVRARLRQHLAADASPAERTPGVPNVSPSAGAPTPVRDTCRRCGAGHVWIVRTLRRAGTGLQADAACTTVPHTGLPP
jgi:hypothetical protein